MCLNNKHITLCLIGMLILIYQSAAYSQKQRMEFQTNKGCAYVENVSAQNIERKKQTTVTWTGACLGGYVSGSGTLTASYPDGTVQRVKGNYVNGIENGNGLMFSIKDGKILITYDGNFVNGVPNGKGYLIDANETTYTGNFKDGKISGSVFIKTKDGVMYNGGFENGMMEGVGTRQELNGDSISGQWKAGKPDGIHIFEEKDKTVAYFLYENGELIYRSPPIYYSKMNKNNPNKIKWNLIEYSNVNLHFLNMSSLKRNGSIVSFWVLIDHRFDEVRSSGSALSYISQEQIDCSRDTFRVIYANWYSLRQGKGDLIDQMNFEALNHPDSQWRPIAPETIASATRKVVCK